MRARTAHHTARSRSGMGGVLLFCLRTTRPTPAGTGGGRGAAKRLARPAGEVSLRGAGPRTAAGATCWASSDSADSIVRAPFVSLEDIYTHLLSLCSYNMMSFKYEWSSYQSLLFSVARGVCFTHAEADSCARVLCLCLCLCLFFSTAHTAYAGIAAVGAAVRTAVPVLLLTGQY